METPNLLYFYKIEEVVRVVDGDTIDAMIDVGFKTYLKKRIRLIGINTPEKRGKTKLIGLEATEHLETLLQGDGPLLVHSDKVGKFGRVLGVLYKERETDNLINLNEQMVADGHAVEYDGGKRSDDVFLTPEFLRGREAA